MNFFQHNACAQNPVLDSLNEVLKNVKHDTTRVKVLAELSEKCELDDILKYAEPCVILAKKNAAIEKDTLLKKIYLKYLAHALNNIGFLAYEEGNFKRALEFYEKSLKIKEEIKDKTGIASVLNNIGGIYHRVGNITKALEFNHKSLNIHQEINDKEGIAGSLNNIGYIYDDQGDIPKALEYYHRSIKIHEEINNKDGIAQCLNNIGAVYEVQGDVDKALEYYGRSFKIREQLSDKQAIAISLNNLGGIYFSQGDFVKAFEYYNRSLKIREETGDKIGIALSLNSIAGIYNRKGNFDSVLYYNYKALKIQEEMNNKDGVAHTLSSIAYSTMKLGNVKEALKHAARSLKAAKEIGYPKTIRDVALVLKKIYGEQEKSVEALEMFELYILMRDSIANHESRKSAVKKQFQYLYEKKAAADSVKNEQEHKVKNAELHAQKAELKQKEQQRNYFIIGFALVALLAVFIFRGYRQKLKANIIITQQKAEVEKSKDIIEEQKKIVEEKQKEVLDSIRYAKRIQTALLPNEKRIDKELKKLMNHEGK